MNPLLDSLKKVSEQIKPLTKIEVEGLPVLYLRQLTCEEQIELEKACRNQMEGEKTYKKIFPARLCDEKGNKIINNDEELKTFLSLDSEIIDRIYFAYTNAKVGTSLEDMKKDFSETR